MAIQQTNAIIFKAIPYGETSLIVTALTYKFGVQMYMVKGARKTNTKGRSIAQYFQPMAQLDLVVYHQPNKNFQYIKEVKWLYIYQNIFDKVLHNTVAIYMAEMLQKTIKEPEENEALYEFIQEHLRLLDEADWSILANLPIYFALHLGEYLGFKVENNYDASTPYLDWHAGRFAEELPHHLNYLPSDLSAFVAQFLETENAITLYRIKTTRIDRQLILQGIESFYNFHISDFGTLKSLTILTQILDV